MCATADCPGWVLLDGQERPCPDEVHRTRLVGAGTARVVADITAREWDFWCTRGYIDTQRAPGSGHVRLITEYELGRLRLMAELVVCGMRPGKASEVAWRIWEGSPLVTPVVEGLMLRDGDPS